MRYWRRRTEKLDLGRYSRLRRAALPAILDNAGQQRLLQGSALQNRSASSSRPDHHDGTDSGQRSTLTSNDTWYYIDTTVPASQQTGVPDQNGRSVFLSGHTYYVYLVYGTPTTHMTYWMYVGSGAEKKTVEDQVGRYPGKCGQPDLWIQSGNDRSSEEPRLLNRCELRPDEWQPG